MCCVITVLAGDYGSFIRVIKSHKGERRDPEDPMLD
jgi:hypothetical protein